MAAHIARRPADLVGRGDRLAQASAGELRQQRTEIVKPLGDHMHDAALVLDAPLDRAKPRGQHLRAETLEHRRPDDDVGDVRLILQRHEDDAGRSVRALADKNEARRQDASAVAYRRQPVRLDDAARGKLVAKESGRMRLQGKPERPVILDHMLAEAQRRKIDVRLAARHRRALEQRQILLAADAAERPRRPQGLATVKADRPEGVRLREPLDSGGVQPPAQPDVSKRIVARPACGDETPQLFFLETVDLTKAEPQRMVRTHVAAHLLMARMETSAGARARLECCPNPNG
jgi:hypothetical protein